MSSSPIAPAAKPLTGRTVLFALLGFFAVVAAVNAVFIFYALRTHPGLSEDNAYQTGIAYNGVLADAEAQRRLGWHIALALSESPQRELTLRVLGRDGAPIAAQRVTAQLRRPGLEAADHEIALIAAGPGLWRASTADLAAGNWDVHVEIARDGAAPYRTEWRVLIQQGSGS